MITLQQIDLTGINSQLQALQDALVGAGKESDLSSLVKTEGRWLAWEISRKLGPRKKEDAIARIYLDAKKVFAPEPETVFEMSKRNGKGGDSGLSWLYAGPAFLVGIPMENIQLGLSATTMRKDFESYQKQTVGNAWDQIDIRGKQNVMKWNRIVVGRDAFKSFVKSKNDRTGRLRATFAYTASMLGQGRIPGWVSRHFDKVKADGAAIYDAAKLQDKVAPSLTFGSSSPGLITNFIDVIEGAIETRAQKLAARIQDIIHNYSKDWMAGRKINRKAKE